MTGRQRGALATIVIVILSLAFVIHPNDARGVDCPQRLTIAGDHLACSIVIPPGWRPYTSANGLQYLLPANQENEIRTGIYVWATSREGKVATPLFDDDEILTTSDGEPALVRYCRQGIFQSVISLSEPTTPGAVAYIEEGDYFVEVVVGSTDADFAEAKQAFKTVVESYRRTPPN